MTESRPQGQTDSLQGKYQEMLGSNMTQAKEAVSESLAMSRSAFDIWAKSASACHTMTMSLLRKSLGAAHANYGLWTEQAGALAKARSPAECAALHTAFLKARVDQMNAEAAELITSLQKAAGGDGKI